MDDTLACPICGNMLRNIKKYGPLYHIGSQHSQNYIERLCTVGPNHRGLQFFVNEESGKVDLLKIPLDIQYTRHLSIDFLNQRCRITITKYGNVEHINIDKMVEPDFPSLTKLKERIALYLTFS
jgi:hypothetical protein